jgi:serine/threonine protein kinase
VRAGDLANEYDRWAASQVMHEVPIMNRIKHPNVLGFKAWYETRNHIWVIQELCAARLDRLLHEDKRFSENAARVRVGYAWVHVIV